MRAEAPLVSFIMRVEIINTGSELLLGKVTNTHLPWLAQQLFSLGWRVERQVTVPDGPAIRESIVEARTRAEVIIVTGGLGPTSDDLTRPVVAELLGRKLILDREIQAQIRERFARRQLTAPDCVSVQALVPEGALVLPNDFGTAPGLLLEDGEQTFLLLPGPPSELRPMWSNHVQPWLLSHRRVQTLLERTWRIVGLGESQIQELLETEIRKLGDVEVGYCARVGEVDFRLIGTDSAILDQAAKLVQSKVGEYVVSEEQESLESVVVQLATAKGWKVATIESCTGGLVAHRLTNVPGSSAVFSYGWVTYANEAKMAEVGVSAEILQSHGAVSEACVRAMAEGGRRESGADLAVAISGIAGPGGGTAENPVGTCWLAISSAQGTHSFQRLLATDRESFKQMASQAALDLLRRELITP